MHTWLTWEDPTSCDNTYTCDNCLQPVRKALDTGPQPFLPFPGSWDFLHKCDKCPVLNLLMGTGRCPTRMKKAPRYSRGTLSSTLRMEPAHPLLSKSRPSSSDNASKWPAYTSLHLLGLFLTLSGLFSFTILFFQDF